MEIPKKQSLTEEELYVVETLPDIISERHCTYNGYIQLCFHKFYGYVYSLGRSDIPVLNDQPIEWLSLEGQRLQIESQSSANSIRVWLKNIELIKLMKKECSSSGYKKISYFKDNLVKITKYCGFEEN